MFSVKVKKPKPIIKHKDLMFGTVDNGIVEVRVIDLLLSKEYQKTEFEEDRPYRLTADYYAEKCGTTVSEGYRQIKDVAIKLYSSSKETKDINTGTVTLHRYVSEISYNDLEQFIEVIWNPKVIPLISGVMENGTFNRFDDRICLVSSSKRHALVEYIHSRLYELNKETLFWINLDDLRARLNMVDEYPKFADFRRRVLEPVLVDVEELFSVKLVLNYKRSLRRIEFRKA